MGNSSPAATPALATIFLTVEAVNGPFRSVVKIYGD